MLTMDNSKDDVFILELNKDEKEMVLLALKNLNYDITKKIESQLELNMNVARNAKMLNVYLMHEDIVDDIMAKFK